MDNQAEILPILKQNKAIQNTAIPLPCIYSTYAISLFFIWSKLLKYGQRRRLSFYEKNSLHLRSLILCSPYDVSAAKFLLLSTPCKLISLYSQMKQALLALILLVRWFHLPLLMSPLWNCSLDFIFLFSHFSHNFFPYSFVSLIFAHHFKYGIPFSPKPISFPIFFPGKIHDFSYYL